ncbi:MAG: radical SAM protein [Candidatus Methanomethylicaceae archaeon]
MPEIFRIPSGAPLIGSVSFGVIDRGTNVIQVRPSTSCSLSCIFCSTDAGPCSRRRRAEYLVDLDHMMEWVRGLVAVKGGGVEAHIDTVGDPFTYPRLVDLVSAISDLGGVETISLQTHGYLMSEGLISNLAEAGLDRVNLSLDSVDPDLAKKLSGAESYDLKKIVDNAQYLVENTSIDLLLAPVWVHPLNDDQLEGLIDLAKRLGAGRKWPPLGIQKCEFHKSGRRTKEMKQVSWYAFYRRMRELEKVSGVKMVLRPSDFGIRAAPSVAVPFGRGEKLSVRVIGPGWLKGESLAATKDLKWAVTVVGHELPVDEEVRVRLLRTRDNILIGILC